MILAINKAYRYDGVTYAHWDSEYDRVAWYDHKVELREYAILKHTPKGFWINVGVFGVEKRFVLRDARKKFAALDKRTALESFIARKKKQQGIYLARAAQVGNYLAIAEALKEKL